MTHFHRPVASILAAIAVVTLWLPTLAEPAQASTAVAIVALA